jgi:hypothetical protein
MLCLPWCHLFSLVQGTEILVFFLVHFSVFFPSIFFQCTLEGEQEVLLAWDAERGQIFGNTLSSRLQEDTGLVSSAGQQHGGLVRSLHRGLV